MRNDVTPKPARRRTMLRASVMCALLLPMAAAIASAHDMFIRPERFRVAENTEILVRLLNGTFSRSLNSIARVRLADVRVQGSTALIELDTADWNATGDTSTFRFRTGGAGTYVIGVSTRPNVIAMSGADFARYLREDGIPDELAQRRREGIAADSARERYAKHVKALLQVGATPSDDYATVLGYPAELVPLDNPYARRGAGTLRFRVLVDGQPVANQYVQYGGRTANGARIAMRGARSNAEGIVRIPVQGSGPRFVKFISMTRTPGAAETTHESKWATLTFEVR